MKPSRISCCTGLVELLPDRICADAFADPYACTALDRPGSYFGELALMSDEARKATCVALGTTVCLSLGEILVEEELDTTDGHGLLGVPVHY